MYFSKLPNPLIILWLLPISKQIPIFKLILNTNLFDRKTPLDFLFDPKCIQYTMILYRTMQTNSIERLIKPTLNFSRFPKSVLKQTFILGNLTTFVVF